MSTFRLSSTVHLQCWSTVSAEGTPPNSTTSPDELSASYLVFKLRWELAEGTPPESSSFDSDWILRTLSPSNESSKDLNLQRINMNLVYHGGWHVQPARSHKTGQKPGIPTVISISYINQMDRYIIVVPICLVFVLIRWRADRSRVMRKPTNAPARFAKPTTPPAPARKVPRSQSNTHDYQSCAIN